MIAAVALEQPFNLHDVFEEAFLKLKRLWNVEEQPVRTIKSLAWIFMDEEQGYDSLLGFVYPALDNTGRLIFLPHSIQGSDYAKAQYLINPDPSLNPDPPVKGNYQTIDKVGQFGDYISPKTQKWLRRVCGEPMRVSPPKLRLI